jgi:hypothetical protein
MDLVFGITSCRVNPRKQNIQIRHLIMADPIRIMLMLLDELGQLLTETQVALGQRGIFCTWPMLVET